MKLHIRSLRRAPLTALMLLVAAACGGVQPLQGVQLDEPGAVAPEGSQLVVMVVVDQLRGDLLDRYADLFTGGLKRLMDGGLYFPNATHDHASTYTATGHATLATGVHASRHGLVGNTWFEVAPNGWTRSVYAVEDSTVSILGDTGMAGRSPANFERDGLADWLMDAEPEARVVAISRKDRGAIGMAARAKGEVYWIHPQRGRFITSSYYAEDYPDWIRRFNESVMADMYTDTIWTKNIPEPAEARTRPDTASYEGDGVNTFFPHLLSQETSWSTQAAANEWRIATPLPDEAVVLAAETALRDLELGRRGVRDLLALSFSQTDAVGHGYGPRSREQLDNLLRLDRHLGRLMDRLDSMVGPGNWVLAFSSDHGVVDVPEYADPPVERVSREVQSRMFGEIQQLINSGLRGSDLMDRILEAIESYDEVADALPRHEITPVPVDSFAVLYANSFSRERFTSPLGQLGIEVRLQPGTFWGSATPRGTTHGSPYYPDRWVPMIYYGPGVEARRVEDSVSTLDFAPTLAAMAQIPVPNDLDGRDLRGGGG